MRTKIIKTCSVRLDGVVKKLEAGKTIFLPDDKSRRLIDAGYAEPVTIPGINEYRALTRELAERDPKGDCWDWIKQNRPVMWRDFMQIFKGGDLVGARGGFDEIVSAWRETTTDRPTLTTTLISREPAE